MSNSARKSLIFAIFRVVTYVFENLHVKRKALPLKREFKDNLLRAWYGCLPKISS